ncbi:hypothetical protein KOAAANKH_01248 [Brevundimonas sp. NIBR10]|uniref:hypothetical protein n=1 Tax=Brevundimonas sp. NIBR10 TaxID=3015997 RepID=UPI0022F1D2C5|nr:hypothetical protein [Brevundimonas sp. NIBR10]WGM46380.1 hypothetical protein KOAAANKH_01248 [Brevundimonas sp. NIBR10]
MTQTISAKRAVGHGLLTVNGTVMLMMFGPPAIVGVVFWLLGMQDIGGLIALIVIVPSWIGAWIAWSILTPRWRIWAYERVENLDELKGHAVAAGVIWPEGHFLERTEIRSPAQRARLRELEEAHRRG